MKKQRAFTLIELVVVVAIMGILTSIAVPNYIDHVKKARREDAKATLIAFANAMERKYTENSTYCDLAGSTGATVTNCGESTKNDTGSPAFFPTTSPVDGSDKFYDLTISAVSTNSFTLQAVPISANSSTASENRLNSMKDDKCGTLELEHTGKRNIIVGGVRKTGTDAAGCW